MALSDQIISVLDDLAARFGVAIDWSQENVLPYLQELFDKYILYNMLSSIVWIVSVVFLTTVCYVVAARSYKKFKESYNDMYDAIHTVAMILALVLTVATLICLIFCLDTVITCVAFPEKFIIDKLLEVLGS